VLVSGKARGLNIVDGDLLDGKDRPHCRMLEREGEALVEPRWQVGQQRPILQQ
jgi:hypothetical protein